MIFSTHEHFDNAAIANQHIDVRPLAAAMGAEIAGVDCANVSDDAFTEIEAALFRHKMIYFRGQQRMTHGDQSAFSRRFDPFAEDAIPGRAGISRGAADQGGGRADRVSVRIGLAYRFGLLPAPPAISLRSIEIPPFGDTIWANSALAYRALSPTMQGC
jgi:taurine dioxygenase